MKTTINKAALAILGGLMSLSAVSANAEDLNGIFRAVKENCSIDSVYDQDVNFQVTANFGALTIAFDDPQDPSVNGSQTFAEENGDITTRPSQFLIERGYVDTDRKIGAMSDDLSSFTFKEYVYDMHLTDEQGLAQGLTQTVTFKINAGKLYYTIAYPDGEHSACELNRVP